jgi:hypothetical protein
VEEENLNEEEEGSRMKKMEIMHLSLFLFFFK